MNNNGEHNLNAFQKESTRNGERCQEYGDGSEQVFRAGERRI
jgi:hypothetical protein